MELATLRASLRKQRPEKENAEFVTQADIKRCLGLSPNSKVTKYVEGIERIDGKYYPIVDIAKRMQMLSR